MPDKPAVPLRPWRQLGSEVVLQNPWWTYRRDAVELPSGRPSEYHYVHTAGSAMVVPLLPDGRVLLVKQYRYLLRRESLEFPGGGVKPGADHETTARQELAEEAGYAARELVRVGEFNPYNGVTDEMCAVFVARGLVPVEARPDDSEEFVFVRLSPAEVGASIRSGVIWDGMTIAAWYLAELGSA